MTETSSMRRLFDNHSHSYFSEDSRMDIDDAVKTAFEKGLRGICLTDHLDFDAPEGVTEFTFEVPAQQKAIDGTVEYLGLNGGGRTLRGLPASQRSGDGTAGQKHTQDSESALR